MYKYILQHQSSFARSRVSKINEVINVRNLNVCKCKYDEFKIIQNVMSKN